MSSLPGLQPRVFFGLKTGIQGNAQFVTDNDILYPIGGVLVRHNFSQRTQQYIHLPEKQRPFNIICLSPSRKLISLAEKGKKPAIAIYDIATGKRKKLLGLPFETTAEEFAAVSFTFDEKYVIAILGEPDWTLLCYNWEKGKVETTTKANNPQNPGPITQIACNPNDNSVVVAVGPGLFKLMAVTESIWRQFGYQKADVLPLNSVCWITFDRILAGTADARIILVESGELKGMFKALEFTAINAKAIDMPLSVSATNIPQASEDELAADIVVREIISFQKGFAFACGSGTVHVFEKESSHKYRKRNVYKLTGPDFREKPLEDLNIITGLNANVSGDTLLASTPRTQLYSAQLWGPEMAQAPELPFKSLGEDLHHGPINGLAVCAWKPLFLTSGEFDRTVRLWNYDTEKLELTKQYQEDIYGLALHPTGLYAVIGFSDKLRFMTILLDDIVTLKEYPIHKCSECRFSNNGHKFSAANGNIIQIYTTISYENVMNLKGHNGKVKCVAWNHSDQKLVSCGTEGAVYEWDIPTGKRVGEIFIKGCVFSSIVVNTDGNISFGVGSDGSIKEMSNSQIVREISMSQKLDCIVLSRSDQMMFISGANGSIFSIRFPLSEEAEFVEFFLHNSAINRMNMTYDDQTLISCSNDGTMCLWKMTGIAGKTIKLDKDFTFSTEVLIPKDDLEDKIRAIKDLTQRIEELETEFNYQMRQTETSYEDQIKEIHNTYGQVIEDLQDKNENMESAHTREMNVINADIERMTSSHDQAMQSLETNYYAKLIVEYEKYHVLEDKSHQMMEDYERKLSTLANEKDKALQDLTEDYESKLHDKNTLIEELHEEASAQAKEHEEIKEQIEDDADKEIMDIKVQYEVLLKEERESIIRLKAEIGLMKKKFVSTQKEIEEARHQVTTLHTEKQRFLQAIASLERDIADLKKEISERDIAIQDKERRIADLQRKNQELEKFKFVLNYKIKELKNQLEPKDREIKERRAQIEEMEGELTSLHQVNISLLLQVAELKEKLKATDNELLAVRQHDHESNTLLYNVRLDLHNASGLLQEPKKLKETIKNLYHKYSQNQEFLSLREQKLDAEMEFLRQREHLEHTIAILQKQTRKNSSGVEGECAKLMEENANLIVELSNLRRQLKMAQRQINDMESLLGISAKFMTPKEAQARLQAAVKTHDVIQNEYKEKLEDKDKLIALLKEELQQLVQKLSTDDQIEHMRGHKDQMKQLKAKEAAKTK